MDVLQHPEFGRIFGPGSLAEVPVAGMLPGTDIALNGSIDRVFFGEDEILIVDFKTNRPPPLEVDAVDGLYITQMAAYRALLGKLVPGVPVRAGLLWTDGARLMDIPAVLMDEALASIQIA